ncbi:MAG: ABC transporter permease [Gemmatimonadetes bacterium]|nr:ABC transporter permease [Gemmatimonadota bacterium]
MARKEVIQLRRDPRSLGMAFVVPALLTLLFGYVITFDVRDIRLAVLDQDGTQQSRELVQSFASSGYFRVHGHLERDREVAPLLEKGTVRLVLVIPPGFARDLASGRPAAVQGLVDGSDANTASIAMNYARGIVTSFSARAVLRGGTVPSTVSPETRVWYNEELKSSNMVVPGLVAVIMMIIAAMLTALTVAREWERGTMEQLATTPVHRVEVIFGKLLPYLGIGMIDVVVAVTIGITVFGVPFRGNPFFLLAMTFLFLLGALGLGIFISAAIKSQLLATQIAMLATYLPSLLLSGLIFDIDAMPKALRVVSALVPARYFVTVLRGVFLKGVGPEVLWAQGLGMMIFAAAGLTLAVRAFHKEIA